jgi:hypothetical protein
VLHYALYFIAGLGLGAGGVGHGLLAADGALARRWSTWIVPTLVAFGMTLAAIVALLESGSRGGPLAWLMPCFALASALTCATASLLFLGAFLRFARTRTAVTDSLGANAFGIYLLHYACVTWLQYLLLSATIPAAGKLAIVAMGAVAVSWSATAALRRVPLVASVL